MTKIIYSKNIIKFFITLQCFWSPWYVIAQTNPQIQWQLIGKLQGSDLYIRKNSLERIGHYLKVWVLYDYNQIRAGPKDEEYRSASSLFQFDCEEKKSQKLSSYGYLENMGEGRQIDLTDNNPQWIDLPEDSIGLYIIQSYCTNLKN